MNPNDDRELNQYEKECLDIQNSICGREIVLRIISFWTGDIEIIILLINALSKNTNIQKLELIGFGDYYSSMTLSHFEKLGSVLASHPSLVSLTLSSFHFESTLCIANIVLKNKSLKDLSLCNTWCLDENTTIWRQFLSALLQNQTLQSLDLTGSFIREYSNRVQFAHVLKHNRSLQNIKLKHSHFIEVLSGFMDSYPNTCWKTLECFKELNKQNLKLLSKALIHNRSLQAIDFGCTLRKSDDHIYSDYENFNDFFKKDVDYFNKQLDRNKPDYKLQERSSIVLAVYDGCRNIGNKGNMDNTGIHPLYDKNVIGIIFQFTGSCDSYVTPKKKSVRKIETPKGQMERELFDPNVEFQIEERKSTREQLRQKEELKDKLEKDQQPQDQKQHEKLEHDNQDQDQLQQDEDNLKITYEDIDTEAIVYLVHEVKDLANEYLAIVRPRKNRCDWLFETILSFGYLISELSMSASELSISDSDLNKLLLS